MTDLLLYPEYQTRIGAVTTAVTTFGVFGERILFSDWTILIGNSSDNLVPRAFSSFKMAENPLSEDFPQKQCKSNTGWVRSIEKVM